MGRYVLRRSLAIIPVLIGVTLLVFAAIHALPGSKVLSIVGFQVSPEMVARIESYYGLDQPMHVQYARYMGHLLSGDLGYSISRKSQVGSVLAPAVANTAILAGTGLVLAVLAGLIGGFAAAFHAGSPVDRGITSLMLIVGTAPPFWLALVLILVLSIQLELFPATGMYSPRGEPNLPDLLHHLVLPALAVAAQPAAIIAKVARSAMLEVRGAEFVTAARAKGLPRSRVFSGHVLRNVLSPIVTITGLQLGYLVGGVIFVEVVFGWPGIGFQLFQSILARDITLTMGASLIIAFAFVFVNFLADLINALLDPRHEAQ